MMEVGTPQDKKRTTPRWVGRVTFRGSKYELEPETIAVDASSMHTAVYRAVLRAQAKLKARSTKHQRLKAVTVFLERI